MWFATGIQKDAVCIAIRGCWCSPGEYLGHLSPLAASAFSVHPDVLVTRCWLWLAGWPGNTMAMLLCIPKRTPRCHIPAGCLDIFFCGDKDAQDSYTFILRAVITEMLTTIYWVPAVCQHLGSTMHTLGANFVTCHAFWGRFCHPQITAGEHWCWESCMVCQVMW